MAYPPEAGRPPPTKLGISVTPSPGPQTFPPVLRGRQQHGSLARAKREPSPPGHPAGRAGSRADTFNSSHELAAVAVPPSLCLLASACRPPPCAVSICPLHVFSLGLPSVPRPRWPPEPRTPQRAAPFAACAAFPRPPAEEAGSHRAKAAAKHFISCLSFVLVRGAAVIRHPQPSQGRRDGSRRDGSRNSLGSSTPSASAGQEKSRLKWGTFWAGHQPHTAPSPRISRAGLLLAAAEDGSGGAGQRRLRCAGPGVGFVLSSFIVSQHSSFSEHEMVIFLPENLPNGKQLAAQKRQN